MLLLPSLIVRSNFPESVVGDSDFFNSILLQPLIVVDAWAVLFAVLDSSVVVEIETLLISVVPQTEVPLLIVPLIVIVEVAAPARSPMLQVTVCEDAEQVPLPAGLVFVHVPDVKVTPVGRVSVTTTPAAVVEESRFVTVIVYWIDSPNDFVAGPLLLTEISVTGTTAVAGIGSALLPAFFTSPET